VSVKASSGALLRIDATATGTFFMRISAVRVGSCGWYSVRAIGGLGTLAGAKVVMHCPPSSVVPDEPPPGYPTANA